MIKNKSILVGVGVLIFKAGRILLGKRRNSHGENTYAPPGGHLEWFESPFDCAKREVMEETGLTINHLQKGPWTNDIFSEEDKHYMTSFVFASTDGEPKCLEPDKCLGWQWFSVDDLPSPLFLPLQHVLAEDKGVLERAKQTFSLAMEN